MRLLGLNLENFRNLRSQNLKFQTDRIFFIGENGQGKSNLLEAIGICSSLRSFRGASTGAMVTEGEIHSRLFATFLDDDGTAREALISFGAKGGKQVEVDGEPVKKLGDFLGQFPCVSMSSRDFRLVRESPSDRRKWMDLLLSSTSAQYLNALQGYYRSMKGRNVLLKKQAGDAEISAFEHTLASSAMVIQEIRAQLFPSIEPSFENAYRVLSSSKESATMRHLPDCSAEDTDHWLELYARERPRDRIVGMTRKGPHRDDFSLFLDGRDAKEYGSEGQQKGVVLSLRIAEFYYLRKSLGRLPILLADDVLGELDKMRRANFRNLLPTESQTFASGTTYPSEREKEIWETFLLEGGTVQSSAGNLGNG